MGGVCANASAHLARHAGQGRPRHFDRSACGHRPWRQIFGRGQPAKQPTGRSSPTGGAVACAKTGDAEGRAVCRNASAHLARHAGQGRPRRLDRPAFGPWGCSARWAATLAGQRPCVGFFRSRPASEAALREKQPPRAGHRVCEIGRCRESGQRSSPTGGVCKRFGSFSTARGAGSVATFRLAAFHPRGPCDNFWVTASEAALRAVPSRVQNRTTPRVWPAEQPFGGGVRNRFSSFSTGRWEGSAAISRPPRFRSVGCSAGQRPWRQLFRSRPASESGPTGEAAPRAAPRP